MDDRAEIRRLQEGEAMNQADEFHRKAEALATLAEMFPDRAEQYRAREQQLRRLEAAARDPGRDASVERRRMPAVVR